MSNMQWPNKSIIKSSKLYDVKKLLANRPKGISDEDWNEYIKEEKLNKLIILDKVPKTKRSSAPRNEE
ncbi:MAG: hypothetical protein EBU90_01105 [Proteobacteria bacterium]|nr:hypothetical protein [Pseudomonadota bacterium]NBP13017.1 hypothetical protein [bacterium]